VVVPVGRVILTQVFRAPADATYAITFRANGTPGTFRFRVDERPPLSVTVSPLEAADAGFAWVGPSVPADGAEPLLGARGTLRVEGGALRMEGRPKHAASWLSPAEVEHASIEAVVSPATEEEGGDDALLLFDMIDDANGRYAGLVDGGRRFVLGLIEGGTLRGLSSAEAPPAAEGSDGKRTIRVQDVDGIAVARLDGKPLASTPFSKRPEAGRFGFLTHGKAVVHSLAASLQYEVHRVQFADRPLVPLSAGPHVLTVELGAPGPSLDTVRIQVSAP
jgi:hypothetical protein